MADGLNMKFDIPAFAAQLRAFGNDFSRLALRAATNAAAQIYKKAAIAKAPILQGFTNKRRVPGTLKRAIYVVRARDSKVGFEHYQVSFRSGKKGTKGRDAFYGRFLEAGWVPRGRGKGLKGGKRSKALQRSRNIAAGATKITKYRFLDPVFGPSTSAAIAAFNAKIQQRLDKENAKK